MLRVITAHQFYNIMDITQQYDILGDIDEGAFGKVILGRDKETGKEVAIKKMLKKVRSWAECTELKEVKCLNKLRHPNIVKLHKAMKIQDELFLVFEFVHTNLYKLYLGFRSRVGL
jgi:serine/threonine protein kinase